MKSYLCVFIIHIDDYWDQIRGVSVILTPSSPSPHEGGVGNMDDCWFVEKNNEMYGERKLKIASGVTIPSIHSWYRVLSIHTYVDW